MCALKQSLGRDTATVQAGPPWHRILLDQHRIESQLSCPDGGDITAGTSPDDRHIEIADLLDHLSISLLVNGCLPCGHWSRVEQRLRFLRDSFSSKQMRGRYPENPFAIQQSGKRAVALNGTPLASRMPPIGAYPGPESP